MLKELIETLNKNDDEFIYNCLEIQNSSESGQSPYRFWYEDFRENCFERKGDIYEFGVYRGSSLIAFALLAKRLGSDKHFWGFDSFSGSLVTHLKHLENFRENGTAELLDSHEFLLKIKSVDTNLGGNYSSLKNNFKKLGKSGLFGTSYDALLKKIEFLELDNITLVPGNFNDAVPNHFNKSKRQVLVQI